MLAVEPHHIIAIGASAGGMEEINSFFDHTPLDGVSYIIIQHLSSDFKSRMVELLARHSKLLVREAEDGMTVCSNEVYLIPHNKFMTIRDCVLHLTDKANIKGPHLTINTFFNSLAADSGKKTIGVILSGLGSDGTDGVKNIKKAGGMVIARNPATSAFPSMPSNAIATGVVDFILEPALMPAAIEDYIKNFGILFNDSQDDEQSLLAIIELIKERSPLDFTEYKQTTILRRTKRRAAYANFSSLANYLSFLKVTPEETDALAKEFLISVTSFFRDKEAFDLIEDEVLPDIFKKLTPGEELKIWVAGCATGEEVYSMAILVAERLNGAFENTVVKIFATDVDSAALSYGAKGVYPSAVTKNIPAERLEKYFSKEGEAYRVSPALRKMVIFAQHDLVKNPPYCNMHFISCRNLLIYMTSVLQKKIFAMLLFGLRKDGYLFLGSSENPMPILKNLEVVDKKWKIYRNLEAKREITFDAFSLPALLDIKNTPARYTQENNVKNTNPALAEAMNTRLASELGYFAVCINENNQVLKSYGDTAKYLLQKHFTLNLTDLLPRPLAIAFNTLRLKATQTGETVSVGGIRIKQGREIFDVGLSVSPLEVRGEQKLFMVIFREDNPVSSPKGKEPVLFDEKIYMDQYTANLEEELKELKAQLQSSHERLDAVNENMQSFNEELISANEEMQSTNEEMQSVNEELHTINTDYQLKNKELIEINDDLNNYFRSNINGQLFIDNDMLLMKFSPGTVKQINLQESDIGRPLSNISTNIKFETIRDDIMQVLSTGTVITKEIETNDGKWYQVMTMPYIQRADNKRNGAIITFNDISELKRIQRDLDLSNKMLGMAVGSAEMVTWSINVNTREFISSPRLKEIFGFYKDEEMSFDAAIAQIENGYRAMVTDAVEENITGGVKYDVEYPLRGYHDGELRWVRAVGNVSPDHENKPGFFTGVANDITVHKQDEIRKNDFIAMVSHELKSPITTLQASIQLVMGRKKNIKDNKSVLFLEKANHQIKKMTTLINGFLNVSSFEAGKIYLNEEAFAINTLLEEIVDDVSMTNTNHNIILQPGPLLFINGDRDKIGQVVNNFISNAIKYSPKGTTIELACKNLNDFVQVSIKDEGAGIEPADQPKLFDRFFRVDNAFTKTTAGFGLGLYLSAEIIHKHGGEVWVESEPGKGATFFFSLPAIKG